MNVSQAVREHIQQRPAINEAYRLGIVNYSALSRRIADELGIDSTDAVLTACRRYTPEDDGRREDVVRHALSRSRLELRTQVGLLSFEQGWDRLARLATALHAVATPQDRAHLLHGGAVIQLVAEEALLDRLTPVLRKEMPLEERRGLAEFNVRSPGDIEEIPGFIASLAGALAGRGIRIVDATTCGRDHLFLVQAKDLPAAVESLDVLLKPRKVAM